MSFLRIVAIIVLYLIAMSVELRGAAMPSTQRAGDAGTTPCEGAMAP